MVHTDFYLSLKNTYVTSAVSHLLINVVATEDFVH